MQHYGNGGRFVRSDKLFRMRRDEFKNATKEVFCCMSVEAHQGGLRCVGSLAIAYANVFDRAGDGLVT